MSQARVFVAQEALESWLTDGRATLEGETLTYGDLRFHAETAVHFLAEVTGGADTYQLLGRVKSYSQLLSLAAEHSPEAVVLGDNAYHVVDGYALTPEPVGDKDLYPELLQLLATP